MGAEQKVGIIIGASPYRADHDRHAVNRAPSALAAPAPGTARAASGTFLRLILPPLLLEHSVDVSRR